MGRRVDKAWYFCLRAFFRQHFPNSFLKDKTDHKSLELQSSTQFSVYSLGPLIIKFIVVDHSEIWKIFNRFHGSHCTSGHLLTSKSQLAGKRSSIFRASRVLYSFSVKFGASDGCAELACSKSRMYVSMSVMRWKCRKF